MDKIEEVKKILEQNETAVGRDDIDEPCPPHWWGEDNRCRICGEPKPELTANQLAHISFIDKRFIKPDESRLLTDEEMLAINNAQPPEAKYGDVFKAITKAQDTKTASYYQARIKELETTNEEHRILNGKLRVELNGKNAESQARVERIFKEIEKLSATEQLPYRDGGILLHTIPVSTWRDYYRDYVQHYHWKGSNEKNSKERHHPKEEL